MSTQTSPMIHLKYDGVLSISTAKKRTQEFWSQENKLYSDIVKGLANPIRTKETIEQHKQMTPDEQGRIKDKGAFVGGVLRDGRRGKEHVINRCLITLDADYVEDVEAIINELELLGCAFCYYTTHSHTPESPRMRFIIPLKEAIEPTEYQASSRMIAHDIGIQQFDHTTFQPERMMYEANVSKNGEYLWGYVDAPFVDAKVYLNRYDDWRDMSQWPQSPREKQALRESGMKKGNPLKKQGIIGEFNMAYDISDAIDNFLGHVYERVTDNRYTYSEGTTSGGLLLYPHDETPGQLVYAYSYHSTDPISDGHSYNAFDLVRIHLFGADDEGYDKEKVDKLPSMKAMFDFLKNNERIHELRQENWRQAINAEFGKPIEEMTPAQRDKLFFQDKKFIAQKMAGWFLENENAFVLREELHLYKEGTYQNAEDDFKLKATIALKDEFVSRRLTETMHYIKNTTPKVSPDEATSMGDYLNVKNGLINLSTMEFTEHTPELRTIMQLPVVYDPNADCPALKQFLKKVTFEECIPIIQEMLGYCLLNTMQYEKSFLLYGEGGNGKGTLISVMQKFFGEQNASNVALQTLSDNRFAAASLFGKMVNLHSDIPNRLIEDSSLFKELTSGDRIQAEEKHKAAFSFNNRAKLVFSANELPSSRDNSEGFHRRWVIVPFPNKFNDRVLRSSLFSDLEMSGILNWAIEGAKRLIKQGGFSESKIVREKVQDYREKSDSVYHFLRERCEVGGANDTVKKQELYNAYRSVCTDWGVHPVNQANFNQRVRVVYPNVYEFRHGKSRLWRHLIFDRQQEIDDDFLS